MIGKLSRLAVCILATTTSLSLYAQEVDGAAVNRISDEAIAHSQVMALAAHWTDRLGGRLSNSPQARAAERWTEAKLREWGLRNIRREGFEFGRGWSLEHSSVRMVTPRPFDLHAIAVTWTPATPGLVRAPVIVAPLSQESDFDQWRGKLNGKVVLISRPDEPLIAGVRGTPHRFSQDELKELESFQFPQAGDVDLGEWFKSYKAFQAKADAFLAAEGAVAWARMAKRPGQVVGEGYFHKRGETPQLPGFEIAGVDYRRLARLAASSEPVMVELRSDAKFHDDDSQAYNVLADIPGREPAAGYVMAGAHIDAWVAGDAAADAGGNIAVVMEAARILSKLEVKPRRTIRFAFWGGEQQGLYGIQNYVERHLADRGHAGDTDPLRRDYGQWQKQFPIVPKAGYRDMAAYFSLDNGPGRIRGIYAENNAAAVPIFRTWLAPFEGLGASTVSPRRRIESGNQYMQDIGLPGFQFIQDPADPDHQIFQTNLDSYDLLNADDLRQNAIILASLLLTAANSDKILAPTPLPRGPGTNR